jgi:predicted DNA-binding WGR domain protein
LDAVRCSGEAEAMSYSAFHLHIQRVDPTSNMARYYRLAIEPTLFGNISVVRNWGRIGTRGQERIHFFENEKQALILFLDILREKRRKGYRPGPDAAKS